MHKKQDIGKGRVLIAGDEICAGIDFDDAAIISNSIVIYFETKNDMCEALKTLDWYETD